MEFPIVMEYAHVGPFLCPAPVILLSPFCSPYLQASYPLISSDDVTALKLGMHMSQEDEGVRGRDSLQWRAQFPGIPHSACLPPCIVGLPVVAPNLVSHAKSGIHVLAM